MGIHFPKKKNKHLKIKNDNFHESSKNLPFAHTNAHFNAKFQNKRILFIIKRKIVFCGQ